MNVFSFGRRLTAVAFAALAVGAAVSAYNGFKVRATVVHLGTTAAFVVPHDRECINEDIERSDRSRWEDAPLAMHTKWIGDYALHVRHCHRYATAPVSMKLAEQTYHIDPDALTYKDVLTQVKRYVLGDGWFDFGAPMAKVTRPWGWAMFALIAFSWTIGWLVRGLFELDVFEDKKKGTVR